MADYKTDAVFIKLMEQVLKVEGGYSDHPSDPGGPTMYGLAWNYNASALQKFGITRFTMRNLTRDQALAIYYDKYYISSDGHKIPDIDLAQIHFDAAVNCGVGQAKQWLNSLSKNPANYEGKGKNKAIFLGLCIEYLAMRMSFYTHAKNRQTFLEGWINRLVIIARSIAQDDPVI